MQAKVLKLWYKNWDFCKQVKEVGINPDFEEAEAGNPLCHACGAEEVIE